MKRIVILLILLVGVWSYGQSQGYVSAPEFPDLPDFLSSTKSPEQSPAEFTELDNIRVLNEESAVISAIDRAIPSVATITISKTTRTPDRIQFNPFDPFSPFRRQEGESQNLERNIGSGFVIDKDLVVTNKHVVSDPEASYSILTNDGEEYAIVDISRDPLNDLAILRIEEASLQAIVLGDSSTLKLGQTVIAIGTPLGEFTNTVTTGIVSGLGRGITAGSPFEGYVERLDNVIQTDAAINPGNSGGPLLNSVGEVIGINTAVSAGSQNIGFAIPVNVVKDLLNNFEESGGRIERPFIGVRYHMISKESAILNEVPEGAYIVEVIPDSPADKAGIQPSDIITTIEEKRIKGEDDRTLQKEISGKKVGDTISISLFRDGTTIDTQLLLDLFE